MKIAPIALDNTISWLQYTATFSYEDSCIIFAENVIGAAHQPCQHLKQKCHRNDYGALFSLASFYMHFNSDI